MPGEVVVFNKDGASLTPFTDIARLNEKTLDPAEWKATWDGLGL